MLELVQKSGYPPIGAARLIGLSPSGVANVLKKAGTNPGRLRDKECPRWAS
jgi:hypothetical protein